MNASSTFDVIVVGAGAWGGTTAYFLSLEGLSLALFDQGDTGGVMGVGGNDWTSVLTAVRSVVPEGDHPVARAVRSARRQAVRADLDGSANLTTIEINPGYNWTGAFYYTDNVPVWDSGQYGEFPMNQAQRDSAGILAIDPMSGDINSDGVFDAADYTVWQDNGGDSIDYRTWEDHFGESIASGIRRRVRAVAPRGSFG